jgi:hypothetical protein
MIELGWFYQSLSIEYEVTMLCYVRSMEVIVKGHRGTVHTLYLGEKLYEFLIVDIFYQVIFLEYYGGQEGHLIGPPNLLTEVKHVKIELVCLVTKGLMVL